MTSLMLKEASHVQAKVTIGILALLAKRDLNTSRLKLMSPNVIQEDQDKATFQCNNIKFEREEPRLKCGLSPLTTLKRDSFMSHGSNPRKRDTKTRKRDRFKPKTWSRLVLKAQT
ncbi:hypothetical protein PIB30_106549, partial [Stylosanthes scabra]|nr:hypothetical protein [Stylosanthes scabra]